MVPPRSTSKTGGGIQRYDVYMDGLRQVAYEPEALNRLGVALLADT